MRLLAAMALCLGGCDRLFGLTPVDPTPVVYDASKIDGKQIDAGPLPDASCGASGSVVTVMLGARIGGPGQASMTDTYLLMNSPAFNYGAASSMVLCQQCDQSGAPWDGSIAVGLLRFDTSPICATATIESAQLVLNTTNDELGDGLVGVYVINEAWDEGSVDGAVGFASWTQRKPGLAWMTPGATGAGSRDPAPVYEFFPSEPQSEYTATIPPAVVAGWVSNPSGNNFGLELAISSGNSDVQFYSRDGATPAQRPGLRVTFRL